MRLVTDRPRALADKFVLMGVVRDSGRDFACLLNTGDGKIYVEEMYWSMNVKGNEATASLRYVDDDIVWKAVYDFVCEKTTIFSPKKLRLALKTAGGRGVIQLDPVLKSDKFPYAPREVTGPRKFTIPLPKAE